MRTPIKHLLSALIVFSASHAAFGMTAFQGELVENSVQYSNPDPFNSPPCEVSSPPLFNYKPHTIVHTGGTLEVHIQSPDFEPYLGIYSGVFNPAAACENALAYVHFVGADPERYAVFRRTLAPGEYTMVATSMGIQDTGTYSVFYNSIAVPATPTSVPVAGIPALALGSLALMGAAGFVSLRRKTKENNA